jgi:hypothetical protein
LAARGSGLTRWLVENPDVISDAIGLPLANLAPEQAAGAFRVDITGEAGDGTPS